MSATFAARILLIAAVVSVAGCGSRDVQRIPLSGNITHSGKPIVSGDVRFVPVAGTEAPQAGAHIENGRFDVAGGLAPGTFRVEIYGYRRSDGQPGPVDLHDAEAAYDQYLPAKHNTQSELRITIEPGATALQRDIAL